MNRADKGFALATCGASVLVPGLLMLLAPFGEDQQALGIAWGWAAAVLVMVPSYLLMSRTVGSEDRNRFLRGFLAGSLGRLFLTVLAVLAFWKIVPEPPMVAFIVTYFLGYFLLTAVELPLSLGRLPGRSAA